MLKLYGHANRLSPGSAKLRVALVEAGASYEYVVVDLSKGEQKRPEFLALNPHGKIPVLVHDDFVLPESDAILLYLAETFPEARLVGPTARDRARALEWCLFGATALQPAYYDIYFHTSGYTPEKRVPAMIGPGRERLARSLGVLETVLGRREYLAGAFSIADLANAAIIRIVHERAPYDRAAYPKIEAWFQRVTARPAWQTAVENFPAK